MSSVIILTVAFAAYRVHVPLARGRLMPEMASIRDDFPALCEPTTAITGRSTSPCTLCEGKSKEKMTGTTYLPSVVKTID